LDPGPFGEIDVPDIAKLMWPRSVAVVGASSDTNGLRGRILQIMRGHAYAGAIYPVSRSEAEVQGLKAYRSVGELPAPVDLAVFIIPAQFVPQELERCGKAGIRAATILSSGFAEEQSEAGARLQDEVRAIAERYDMAVNGPNGEGFANTEAALCPTFSPAMEAGATPLIPPGRARPQAAVIAQSGGLGFAFFDRGRPKDLSFRYIVTTGNEACLEIFDFVDYMLDEGRTDVFLLLIEDVKDFAKLERVAAKALAAGKPLIVSKLGQSEAGSRAIAAHTAARAGSHDAYRAAFARHGVIECDDIDVMIDIAAGFLACGTRLPAGNRVGICTSSGGAGAWLADTCTSAGLNVPELDAATRAAIDVHLPAYGTSQNPVDVTAQGVHKLGYAAFARLLARSPVADGVIVVVTGRSPRLLMGDREAFSQLAQECEKPVFIWSYTQPVESCARLFSDTGYPLFTNARNCARAMRAMADYAAARARATGAG
jgi:acyl-CoA synthetase (NDP forming)